MGALKSHIEEALNRQLNRELYASHFYLSLTAYFDSLNLQGFAQWMKQQSAEEWTHAMKFFGYILDREGRVIPATIDKPPHEFNSVLEAMEKANAQEAAMSVEISKLAELAAVDHDLATQTFLQWFIMEQVEDEKRTRQIVEQLKFIGNESTPLFMIDRQLAAGLVAGKD